jgi:nucleotide-binding universal stress UspA family protein
MTPAMRRVLCACDFSGSSARALGQAIRVARASGAALTVLHVIPATVPASGGVASLPNRALLDPGLPVNVTGMLRRFHAHVAGEGGPAVRATIEVRTGRPADEILKRADALSCDLIVVGSHGRGGFERWALGSVTERLLRRSRRPVLIVPARGPLVTERLRFRTLLWATDFSASAAAALAGALRLAGEGRPRLTALHVVRSRRADLGWRGRSRAAEAVDEIVERARAALREAVPRAARARCRVEERVASGKAHVEILRLAVERGAELVVIGAQGSDALGRFVFGSTAHKVIRAAPCPVLAARSG